MKSFNHEGVTYKHGDHVQCKIQGAHIKDARISIQGTEIYICQNQQSGRMTANKFGYKFSWIAGECSTYLKEYGVTELRHAFICNKPRDEV